MPTHQPDDFHYADSPAGGYQFFATIDAADGTGHHVVTDHLALMYDLIMNSMDMGSGFLDQEDCELLAEIGRLCGFALPKCGNGLKPANGQCSYLTCTRPAGHEPPHRAPVTTW